MDIQVEQGSIQESQADTIVVNLFAGITAPRGATGALDSALDGAISEVIAAGDFTGEAGDTLVLYPRQALAAQRVIIVGLGPAADFSMEGIRLAAAAALQRARQLKADHVATIVHGAGIGGFDTADAAEATAEGSLLANYQYAKEGQPAPDSHQVESLTIVEFDATKIEAIESGVKAATGIAAGVSLARNLVNMPPNVATPTHIAAEANAIAEEYGMQITVGDREWARERDMGAYLAVAQGAGEQPKFIVLEHNAERSDLEPVILVGKGITFDTGGISLKSSSGIAAMKMDMAGAAAVLGAMRAVGALSLPLRVIGIAPCTENMPDAIAYHPADVIRASNGTTIEIISTDAEGRLVLSDALVLAGQYKPRAVIDLATLTGSCIVALGENVAAGLFGNNDELRDELMAASEATAERLWPMPLWDDYLQSIKSDVADIKNSGGRMGGVGTSAMFLKQFVDYPWAHIDMAGMALRSKAKGYTPTGGSGFGVRLLLRYLTNLDAS